MAKKKKKYSEALGLEFLGYCKEGKSLAQISTITEVPVEQWRKWNLDPKNFHFHKIWIAGKTASQAYHEDLLEGMIQKGASGPVIEAQKYILRVRFKEDWSEKVESKLEISHINQLSDKEIDHQLEKLLIKPSIKKKYQENNENQEEQQTTH